MFTFWTTWLLPSLIYPRNAKEPLRSTRCWNYSVCASDNISNLAASSFLNNKDLRHPDRHFYGELSIHGQLAVHSCPFMDTLSPICEISKWNLWLSVHGRSFPALDTLRLPAEHCFTISVPFQEIVSCIQYLQIRCKYLRYIALTSLCQVNALEVEDPAMIMACRLLS